MVRVSQVRVDDTGIALRIREDVPVDLSFDGRRIGSFWSLADTESDGSQRVWAWPTSLAPHLDGVTDLRLSVHGTDEELFVGEVSLGSGQDRITVEDGKGNPLGLDKSFKLMRLFESRSAEHLKPLLDSVAEVIGALQQAGIRPFLAYGTLLGAVREGALIGHDSDADLGYISEHTHPADVMLESMTIQRRLSEAGYRVTRYSGSALKVTVIEGDGTHRGLDVFGGFMREGMLYLMGEVGHPFEPDWLYPLAEAGLEGRQFPVPAVPEKLLEATYGPTWRVPDPAYKFETPRSVKRRLNGWFRGTRVNRDLYWVPHYAQAVHREPRRLSDFAAWVHKREDAGTTLVDLGCGEGSDTFRLATRGRTGIGLDYCPRAFNRRARRAGRRELPATYSYANLSEVRSALANGVWLGHPDRPVAIMARHLVDATDAFGRRNLLRLARLTLHGGGRLYVECYGPAGTRTDAFGLKPVDIEEFTAQAVAAGARVVDQTWLPSPEQDQQPEGAGEDAGRPPSQVCRLVLEWQ